MMCEKRKFTHQEKLSGSTDTIQSARDIDGATLLPISNAWTRWQLDRCAGSLHHLLKAETALTDNQSVMLWGYVNGDVHHHRLVITHNTGTSVYLNHVCSSVYLLAIQL